MGRDPRYLPSPDSLVEITVRTVQGRYLLRPGLRLNEILVGVLAYGQLATGMRIHGVVAMSNHYHLLASPATTRQMSEFMRLVNTNLSKEVDLIHDWPGAMFAGRYKSVPVSDEPQAQIARLRYLLAQGAKEGLVPRPTDWPGAHSSRAMLEGRSMKGIWIDRTALFDAKQRGEDVTEADVSRAVELTLDPIPCWADLEPEDHRFRVAELVDAIEREAIERHRRDGTAPKGASWVRSRHPHERPASVKRSPKPRFHAFARRVREHLVAAYRAFLAAYRVAAERLASGDVAVRFPENCHPPALPFVEPPKLEPG